ncbi:tRNA 2-selenouridine(34) synthase MnmH [Sulfuriferula nivalis]|uniref:tRNA 2-selenouridine synthase n=1 Tax=Sulfuriferula nivalis TaxID=2675298 RepID=A0A809S8M7_9PROT|nr:tRNA 2-selenouridine(34) synthase MnmH [Sulfuriferula nivalis]BBP00643.1 tRNA 2-selenouridine synthase [Sulfuriferula nivalis]
MRKIDPITVAQLADFDEIIDVRSPAEFAEDHIPGAVSYPVLNNEERAIVGTLYKQVSDFEAKKVGAALIARNIAHHLEAHFASKPKNWRPLIYCWRGGSRSGAMAHILNQVGWRASKFDGGYKTYRRSVLADLASIPATLQFIVVCGMTGSGKSRLLQALQQQGAQVLDLEQIAQHRGSILGNIPDAPQPSQKMFDSQIWWQLRQFDPSRPVYIEAESKKVGKLRVPEAVVAAMWQKGQCLRLDISDALRVELLKADYEHYLNDPDSLKLKLTYLTQRYGHAQIEQWQSLIDASLWNELVQDLLVRHYDPHYSKSIGLHYPDYMVARCLTVNDISADGWSRMAQQILIN